MMWLWRGCRGLAEGCRGLAGGCRGVLRPARPPPTPDSTSYCCMRSPGVGEVLGMSDGGKAHHHTSSLSSTAFTWSKRKRRKELEGLLSVPCPRNYSYFTESGEETKVKDDEAHDMVVMVRKGGGDFYDTDHHFHRSIKPQDIGVKVNVGEPVISELQRHFNIPRQSALKMVRSKDFLLVSDVALLNTIHFLGDCQILSEQLMRIPWILLQPADTLHQKFQKLQEPHLFLNLTDGLGFCRFPLQQISRYQRGFAKEAVHFCSHPNRVYYLAACMEVPVPLVTEKVIRTKHMLRMDIKKMNQVIDLFHKYGVSMKDVLSDMWVFSHNIQVTEDRLRQAVDAGCTRPKPWICHSSPHVFERYIRRLREKRELLGKDGNLASYLSMRLHCPVYEVHAVFHRMPTLRRGHVAQIKSKLDLLFAEGFTVQDVRDNMRILQYSEKRARRRIKELKSLGETSFPIRFLYKQQKTYNNIIWRMKMAKAEEEMERKMMEEQDEVMKNTNEKENSIREGR